MTTNILKGITEKSDGNMRMVVEEGVVNRQRYFDKKRLSSHNLVTIKLVHGNKVVVVTEDDNGETKEGCDGLVTNVPSVIIGVTVADCLPIYFWNKQKNIVGIAHAGWRGVRSEITKEMISVFKNSYACEAVDVCVEIGPHILGCHFEIQDDLVEIFSEYEECIQKVKGHTCLQLQEVVKKQLLSVGVSEKNIQLSSTCTYCSDNYFSYRRDKPEIIEAMLAYIMIDK